LIRGDSGNGSAATVSRNSRAIRDRGSGSGCGSRGTIFYILLDSTFYSAPRREP
jgi:hypothetical protein